jgi:hypothetical protein
MESGIEIGLADRWTQSGLPNDLTKKKDVNGEAPAESRRPDAESVQQPGRSRCTTGEDDGGGFEHGRDLIVSPTHPMGGEQVGWDAARASFEEAAGPNTDSHVDLIDQRICASEDLAYETGIERGRAKLSSRSSSSIA